MSSQDFQQIVELRVDLHAHTKCSDGSLTPQELIDRAVNFQIDMLAITDHDSVEAIDIAKEYILAQNIPLQLVAGTEISTGWNGFEIHVVGLNIDHHNTALGELLASQIEVRTRRAETIGNKLAKCGFADVYPRALAMAGTGSVTRTHFAKALLEQGHVNNMQAAFDKYIGKGKRAYVKPQWCSVADAVKVITAAGGIAVLAHPIRYDLSAKWLRRLIVEFKDAGGQALETVLPQMGRDQLRQMTSYCLDYNLYASMGSDFHYPSQWNDLGKNLRLSNDDKPVWALWQ